MENLPSVVESALKGDQRALGCLVTEFQSMAIGVAYSLVGDYHIAEDVAQEAFIQALRSLPNLRNNMAFPRWLKTIVRFTCTRYLRSKRLQMECLDEALDVADGRAPHEEVEQKEQKELLWQAIRGLPEVDRCIIVLYYIHECSHRQVAAYLHLSESKVNNRLHALRHVLRKELSLMEAKEHSMQATEGFSRRVLEGVQKVGFFDAKEGAMFSPSVGSLVSVMAFLGARGYINYDFVAATSGAAFRAVWQEGWADNNNDILIIDEDPLMCYRRGFEATGCQYEARYCEGRRDWWSSEIHDAVTWSDERQTTRDIVESINRGIPVLALGIIGPPECSIVTGYDEEGQVLLGWSFFQGGWPGEDFSIDENGYFRKRNWFGNAHAYFVIKEMIPVARGKEILLKTLKLAVAMARRPHTNGTAFGLAAFRACADTLLCDEGFDSIPLHCEDPTGGHWELGVDTRFYSLSDFAMMLAERQRAANYLEIVASGHPDCAEELLAAAEHYRAVSEYANALRTHISRDDAGFEQFRSAEVRSILAGHILQAQLCEERAVQKLERLLDRGTA